MGSIDNEAAATADAIKIPVIDISEPTVEVGKRLVAAASTYGFLYIDTKDTGFTKENVDSIFKLSEKFFASPLDEKQSCVITKDNRGYSGMHSETLDPKKQKRGDFKECMNVGEFLEDGKPRQTWPPAFQGDEDEIYAFQQLCRKTCWRILDLLAIGLEVEEPNFFSSRHTLPSGSVFRLLKYPAIPDQVDDFQPEVDIRAGAHSDYGSCTLLFQRPGQPGLEIKTPQDEWAPVPVIPEGYGSDFPPILINIGDLMSYWTSGLLRSTVHRVIFPNGARKGQDRYSVVWFFHPKSDTELVPIPSRIVQALKPIEDGMEVGYGGGAATKKATTAQQHLMNRLAATYGFAMDEAGK